MFPKQQAEDVRRKVVPYFEKAGIVLTDQEKENIEVADFGLNDIGLTLVPSRT